MGGDISFGLTSKELWFWLPATKQLVRLERESGKAEIVDTGTPAPSPTEPTNSQTRVQKSFLLDSEDFLAEVTLLTKSPGGIAAHDSLFLWNAARKGWVSVLSPHAANHLGTFLGVDQNQLVFVRSSPGNSGFEIDWVPLGVL